MSIELKPVRKTEYGGIVKKIELMKKVDLNTHLDLLYIYMYVFTYYWNFPNHGRIKQS